MTKQERKERNKGIVEYFNREKSTVRKTAEEYMVSKSTVHRVLTKLMPNEASSEILETNKRERHIRGGEATKRKYRGE